jgi:uncharacterized membrane protein YjgN (DUF898 family)
MEKQIAYTGSAGETFSVWFLNLIFTILTLGIYRPWARTRMRRYIYAHWKLKGEPLHYTGTGGELMRGAIKVYSLFFLFFIITAVVSFLDPQLDPTLEPEQQPMTIISFIVSLLTYAATIFLVHFGAYSGRRYRMARTTWKGIRGGLTGSAKNYALTGVKYMAIDVLTLGFFWPKHDMLLRKRMVEEMKFGHLKAEFEGDPTPLKKIHLKTWLLMIPTLGISRLWYRAALHNEFMRQMKVGSLRFEGTKTGGELFFLVFGNVLLFCTIIGVPFALHRMVKFITKHTYVIGDPDSLMLRQATDTGAATGDVIDDGYGDDMGFDMGLI